MKPVLLTQLLENEAATIRFGAALAPYLRPGDIVKIIGPLGAGKTTLVRGIVQGSGGEAEQVHSPTFSLVHEYQTASIGILHCDFYRLPENSGLEEWGGLEFFDSNSLFLLEWPERIKPLESFIRNRLLEVHLALDSNGRMVRLFGSWHIVDQNIFGC